MPNEQWSLKSKAEAIKVLAAHLENTKREGDYALAVAVTAIEEGLGGKLTILFPSNGERARTRKGLDRSCDISWTGRELYTWDTGEIA